MNQNNFSKYLQIALKAAELGAKKALSYFDNGSDLGEKLKPDNTNVTIADLATEKVIIDYIKSKISAANFIGEETGGEKTESFWIVDPIDGTRAFARGIGTWAVLISYYEASDFKIGVAYFPVLNELYYAEKGFGGFLNDTPIKISKTQNLSKSLVNSGNPKNYQNPDILPNLINKTAILRGYETTYAHALVASGKMDASVDPYSKLWDFAPFAVIIPEAGGKITNFQGNTPGLEDLGALTSNGLVHDELIKIVKR